MERNKQGPAANDASLWPNVLKGNVRIGLMKLFRAFFTKALQKHYGRMDRRTEGKKYEKEKYLSFFLKKVAGALFR